jgi:hypothetical protein
MLRRRLVAWLPQNYEQELAYASGLLGLVGGLLSSVSTDATVLSFGMGLGVWLSALYHWLRA